MTLEKSLAWFVAVLTAILLVSLYASLGWSEEIKIASTTCPAGAKACKIIVLTDEQVKSLKLILENTNLSGPYLQIKQAVEFYEKLLDDAPAGKPAEQKK